MNRARDWWTQAQGEAKVARFLLGSGHFAWCAFVCHQAAEKALKGLLDQHLIAAWRHDLGSLLGSLPEETHVPEAVRDACSRPNKHYIPPRYVDAFPTGAPIEQYREAEATQAIRDMEEVLDFVGRHLGSPSS